MCYGDMNNEDFILASQLQKQFEDEIFTSEVMAFNNSKPNKTVITNENRNPNKKEASLVDPSWEYIDPTPDVHALFIQFNKTFFWNELKHVEVRWSPRMTSCAGVCCYEGRGGLCSIRLSVPLLKLRPRKDLVETLLHEMIHAYLFVTHNNRDRDGHGPEFHKHMYRINKKAGTNITVYHSFHDEVKLYKQHWWRCNGPCAKRPPYFGMVKRAMNRPPGPSDFWWSDHERNCGGRYIKVKEPEGFSDKKAKQGNKNGPKGITSKRGDIRSYISMPGNKNSNKNESVNGIRMNGVVSLNNLFPSSTDSIKNKVTSTNNNIMGLKDLNSMNSASNVPSTNNASNMSKRNETHKPPVPENKAKNGSFSGKAGLLTNKGSGTFVITAKGNKKEQNIKSKAPSTFIPFSGAGHKLGSSNIKSQTLTLTEKCVDNCSDKSAMSAKRHSTMTGHSVDMKRSKIVCIDLAVNSEDDVSEDKTVKCPVCGIKINEPDINNHLDSCLAMSEDSEMSTNNLKSEPHSPPSCDQTTSESELLLHQETCSGKKFDIVESDSDIIKCPVCNKNILKSELCSHLDICLEGIFESDAPEESRKLNDVEYECPCCGSLQTISSMNYHLDQCLGSDGNDSTAAT